MDFKSLKDLLAFAQQKQPASTKMKLDTLDFSPSQILQLLKNPFDANSVMTINNVDDAVFDKMPFFLTLEHLLHIVLREGTVKLTPKGNLSLKICEEITSKKYWKDELSDLYKQRKEEDFQVLHTAKVISLIGGLTRKANGKMNVTKQMQKILEKNDKNALFLVLFQPFMSKFNWGYHDLYTSPNAGQMGWAFSMYMLQKFGDEPQMMNFYAEKYLKAFPHIVDDFQDRSYSTPEKQAIACYSVRTFSRYFNWFGFVDFTEKVKYGNYENVDMFKTDIVDALFSFKLD